MPPTLQSILLADAVHHEPGTGRVTVAGIFDTVSVAPGTDYTAGAVVYFVVRGVHGRGKLTLAYVDLALDLVLVRRVVYFEEDGPSETIGFAVRVDTIPVPRPGSFAWEVYHESELLGAARVEAVHDQTGGRAAGGTTRSTHNLTQVGSGNEWEHRGATFRFPVHVRAARGGFEAVPTTIREAFAGGAGTETAAVESLEDLLAEMIRQGFHVGYPFTRTAPPPTPPDAREWVAVVHVDMTG